MSYKIEEIEQGHRFFHGTSTNTSLFYHLSPLYSDFKIVWVTEDFNIAELFAKTYFSNVKICFIIEFITTKTVSLINLDQSLFTHYNRLITYEEKYKTLPDLRYIHEELPQQISDGALQFAWIGGNKYRDFAFWSSFLKAQQIYIYNPKIKKWARPFLIDSKREIMDDLELNSQWVKELLTLN